MQTDFSSLGPLKPGGAVGFSSFRERGLAPKSKSKKKGSGSEMDSDEDDDDDRSVGKSQDVEGPEGDDKLLSPEDAERTGELAEGVRKIKVCLAFLAIFVTCDVRTLTISPS